MWDMYIKFSKVYNLAAILIPPPIIQQLINHSIDVGMTHDFFKAIKLKWKSVHWKELEKRKKLVFKSCQYLEWF
jgi:hypothetical protein